MKSLTKIALSILGVPATLVFLVIAWLQKLTRRHAVPGDTVILVYSQVAWDEVWQRPQQYAWITATNTPVIYCSPIQPHNLAWLFGKWRPLKRFTQHRQLYVLSPLVLGGHFKSRLINRLNCAIVRWHLRTLISPGSQVHCLTNTPFSYPVLSGLVPAFIFRGITYDVIDDFTLFDWSPSFAREYDARLMRLADNIITGTAELGRTRPGATFIPCGVDFELFSSPAPIPTDIANLPRPLIGYFGTISERLDMALIQELASRFSHGTIILIGPIHLPPHLLARASNILYLGLKNHSQLPGYAQTFDAAIIPFRLTDATLKLNPVKTLEYLAAGCPVIATPLPDLEKFYSDVLYLAPPSGFAFAVEEALSVPSPERKRKGISLAQSASWTEMTKQINSFVLKPGNKPGSSKADRT